MQGILDYLNLHENLVEDVNYSESQGLFSN